MTPPVQAPSQTNAQIVWDSGYVLRNGKPMHVVYEIRNGRAIFQGDINLGAPESIARTVSELQASAQRSPAGVVSSDLGKRWPGGRVPYDFHSVLGGTLSDTQVVLDAMAAIQTEVGGVYFQRRNSWDNDFVVFRSTSDPNECGDSDVGKFGGLQAIYIRESCLNLEGVVIHEIAHALGFWHEQSRCDRDTYVEILWQNIQAGDSIQFAKFCAGAEDLEAYDEGSIMHYRSNAYGKLGPDGQPLQTIRSLRGRDASMGQLDGLSDIDVFTTDDMYQPFGPFVYSTVNQNGNPLLSWYGSGRATSYSISLVRTYEEWDDYSGTYDSYDEYMPIGGSSSTLSYLDTQSTYTGNSLCQLWSDINGSADYRYHYELIAYFANGVSSTPTRTEALMAPAEPPCPSGY